MNIYRVDVEEAYWFLIKAECEKNVEIWAKRNVPEPGFEISVASLRDISFILSSEVFSILTLWDSLTETFEWWDETVERINA